LATTTSRARPAERRSDQRPPRHGGWRGLVGWTLVLPLLVSLPLLGVPARADKRFNLYRFGGEYLERPWDVVFDQFRSIPEYLDFGNFRPLARIVERAQDFLAFAVADALRIPVHMPMRVMGVAALALFAVLTLFLLASLGSEDPVLPHPPVPVLALFPLAFAALLVVAGTQSTVLLYTDLYFTAAGLAVAATLWVARHDHLRSEAIGWPQITVAIGGGVVLASFNELTYLAPPIAVTAVAARGLVTMRLPLRTWLRTAAVKLTVIGGVAFTAVFIPVRLEIERRCSAPDAACYYGSEIDLAAASWGLFSHRLWSWWPPSGWRVAVDGTEGHWYLSRNPALLLAGLLLVVAAVWSWRRLQGAGGSRLAPAAAIGLVSLALLLLPALLATLSVGTQGYWREGWPPGAGWRDTTYLVAGAAALLIALVTALFAVLRGAPAAVHRALTALLVALVLVGTLGTLGANKTYSQQDRGRDDSALQSRFSVAVIDFEDTDEAERYRCRLLEDYDALQRTEPRHVDRLMRGLDAAANALYGRRFCESAG
jgi:hypothetical protein